MIEQYFRAGVRFLWNKPDDGPAGPMDGATVPSVRVASPLRYDGLDGHIAAVDPLLLGVQAANVLGLQMRANVAYSWLDYTPGRTARLPIGGNDILTGYMSGCLIVRGTQGGALSAFHVGTVDNNYAVSLTVKRHFAQHGNLPADATGFDAFAAWSTPEIQAIQGRLGGVGVATPRIFALMTSAGTFYSILMFNVAENEGGPWSNPAGQRYWCVGGKKLVPPLNRDRLIMKLRAI